MKEKKRVNRRRSGAEKGIRGVCTKIVTIYTYILVAIYDIIYSHAKV